MFAKVVNLSTKITWFKFSCRFDVILKDALLARMNNQSFTLKP